MGRKKVEVRKQRAKPYPLQLCVMISPEQFEKIELIAKQFDLTQSQAARLMLDVADPKPKYKQLEIA
jgi:hypothetical protein